MFCLTRFSQAFFCHLILCLILWLLWCTWKCTVDQEQCFCACPVPHGGVSLLCCLLLKTVCHTCCTGSQIDWFPASMLIFMCFCGMLFYPYYNVFIILFCSALNAIKRQELGFLFLKLLTPSFCFKIIFSCIRKH